MKRILSLILALLCLSLSLCGLTAYADEDDVVTFSADLEKMYYDGDTYLRCDGRRIWQTQDESHFDLSVRYEGEGRKADNTKLWSDYDEIIWFVEYYFSDGSMLNTYYIEDKHYDTFMALKEGDRADYEIDFGYPYGNTVRAKKSQLFGEKTDSKEIYSGAKLSKFDVTGSIGDFSLFYDKGLILEMYDGSFYYLDYDENPGYDRWDDKGKAPLIHKITDEALLTKLERAAEEYYDSDYGYFEDTDLAEGFSKTSLCFMFGVVPLALFVYGLVQMLRKKGGEKKMYAVLCITCAAELLVFATLLIKLIK